MTREHVEVVVVMKDGCISANGDGSNETIDQLANGFPFPATEGETKQPRRRSASVPWAKRLRVRAAGGGYADAVRRARWRALPSEPHRRPRSRFRAALRLDCRSQTRCREEIRPTRTYQSESCRATGPQLAEVALPTRPAKTPGFIDTEGFRRKGSKCKVDRLALCFQQVTAHDLRARFIVDIHIGA